MAHGVRLSTQSVKLSGVDLVHMVVASAQHVSLSVLLHLCLSQSLLLQLCLFELLLQLCMLEPSLKPAMALPSSTSRL